MASRLDVKKPDDLSQDVAHIINPDPKVLAAADIPHHDSDRTLAETRTLAGTEGKLGGGSNETKQIIELEAYLAVPSSENLKFWEDNRRTFPIFSEKARNFEH